MSCLIGFTGFVGTYLRYTLHFDHMYNSKNIHEIENKNFNIVYCCGLYARKWYINKNPDEDIDNIKKLISHLDTITCNRFILISTIDIYDNKESEKDESYIPNIENYSGDYYGKHRLMFENYIRRRFMNYNIIRLCGLYGYGLRKNIIYDIIHNRCKLNLESKFQWYNMDWFFSDIEYILKHDIRITNLFTEPLSVAEMINTLSNICQFQYDISPNVVNYNMKTMYDSSGYWKNKKSVINGLVRYYINMKSDKLQLSQLSYIENCTIHENFGIKQLEISPYMTFGENYINKELSYFERWKGEIYSMQSILYPHTFNIFTESKDFIEYMTKLLEICEYIGCKILVFGSPKNRRISNTFNYMEAIELFRKLSHIAFERGVTICIEPNSKKYGCNFINTLSEGYKFVNEVGNDSIALMADTGNMYLEGENLEDIFKYLPKIRHIHFSSPDLGKLTQKINYCYLYNRLLKLGYPYRITIEMSNQSIENIIQSLYNVVRTPKYDIVGGGWYGCHIATVLIDDGYIVNIYEKNNSLISESSFKNQNRLHIRFHYCRSSNTRHMCVRNFDKFINSYPNLIEPIKYNYYVISKLSIIDFESYLAIYKHDNIPFEIVDIPVINITNHVGIIRVSEMYINHIKTSQMFNEKLNKNAKYGVEYTNSILNAKNYDFIINCTYNQFNTINRFKNNSLLYEKTILLLYEADDDIDDISITVVDGNFISLYKYSNKIFTLSSVIDTPLIKSNNLSDILEYKLTDDKLNSVIKNMEKHIVFYYPDFNKHFKYVGYSISYKCKIDIQNDTRELIDIIDGQYRHIICGKICGIFDIIL